jgi:hypothetical protein
MLNAPILVSILDQHFIVQLIVKIHSPFPCLGLYDTLLGGPSSRKICLILDQHFIVQLIVKIHSPFPCLGLYDTPF